MAISNHSETERDQFASRLSFLTVEGTTRDQAESVAASIQRHAEKLTRVSHTYHREVEGEREAESADRAD